jgi:hypothetical protein
MRLTCLTVPSARRAQAVLAAAADTTGPDALFAALRSVAGPRAAQLGLTAACALLSGGPHGWRRPLLRLLATIAACLTPMPPSWAHDAAAAAAPLCYDAAADVRAAAVALAARLLPCASPGTSAPLLAFTHAAAATASATGAAALALVASEKYESLRALAHIIVRSGSPPSIRERLCG